MKKRRTTIFDRYYTEQMATGDPNQCWEYPGCRNPDGYGNVGIAGKSCKAHRLAFERFHGREIAPGMEIMHTCDNPPCMNPAHLLEDTHRNNMLDSHMKERSTTVIQTLETLAKMKANTPRGDRHWTRQFPELVPAGEENPNSTITWEIARDIRARRAAGEPLKEIADRYGISLVTVSMIYRNQAWVEPGQERQQKRKGKHGPEVKPLPVFTCQRVGCEETFARRKHGARESKYCSRKCAATANYGNLGEHAQGTLPVKKSH